MDNSMKRYQFKTALIIILIFISDHLFSQNIVSRSNAGNSAISLNPGFKETDPSKKENTSQVKENVSFNLGMISFSTSDKKLELNHYSYLTPKLTHMFIGISASGEIKNSVASIFTDKNIVSGGEAKVRLGFRLFANHTDWASLLKGKKTKEEIQHALDELTIPASDLWLIFSGSVNGTSFKLFHPDSSYQSQIQKTKFTGSDFNVGFNYWNTRILNNTVLAGVTIGVKRSNNFDDDLAESSREDTKVVTDLATNTTRKIVTKETVYTGNYKVTTKYPLNLDLYFVPHQLQNIAFLGYSSTDIQKNVKPQTKFGFGIFFLKNQNAFNPVAGVTFDYKDVFNANTEDDYKGKSKKFSVSIVTRINLVNNQKKE